MDTNAIIYAMISIGGLGIVFGAILGFASKIFAVDEDPRIGTGYLNAFPEQTVVVVDIPDVEVSLQLSLKEELL